jgi:uncharacterized membrane protein YidH (DUF202 family)
MEVGKILILIGVGCIVFGLLYYLGFGRLPGDINYQRKSLTVSIPIISSIILSIIITLIINLWMRR